MLRLGLSPLILSPGTQALDVPFLVGPRVTVLGALAAPRGVVGDVALDAAAGFDDPAPLARVATVAASSGFVGGRGGPLMPPAPLPSTAFLNPLKGCRRRRFLGAIFLISPVTGSGRVRSATVTTANLAKPTMTTGSPRPVVATISSTRPCGPRSTTSVGSAARAAAAFTSSVLFMGDPSGACSSSGVDDLPTGLPAAAASADTARTCCCDQRSCGRDGAAPRSSGE